METHQRKYYLAYEERYKTAHQKGVTWASFASTPIVSDIIKKHNISTAHKLLEIGCGEGRDARSLLEKGYDLTATDVSKEAISYCRASMPQFKEHFCVLDCLTEQLPNRFDFIYAVALVHMLVLDEDRDGFYRFIHTHLKADGIALICTMGDGDFEMATDIREAFALKERNHPCGKMMVAGTSCRMVSFDTFHRELEQNGLEILETGITSAPPEFDSLMFAVVNRRS